MRFEPITLNISPTAFILATSDFLDGIKENATSSNIRVPRSYSTFKSTELIYKRIHEIIKTSFNQLSAVYLSSDCTSEENLGIGFRYEWAYEPVPCVKLWEIRKRFPLATTYLLGCIENLLDKKDFFCDAYDEIKHYKGTPEPSVLTDYEMQIVEFGRGLLSFAKDEDFSWYISRYNEIPSVFFYRGFTFDTELSESIIKEEMEYPDDITDECFIGIGNFFDSSSIEWAIRLIDRIDSYNDLLYKLSWFINQPIPQNREIRDLRQTELCLT